MDYSPLYFLEKEISGDRMLIFWDIDGTLMYCGSDGTKALNATFDELYKIEDAFHKVGIGSAMDSVILEKIMDKFDIPVEDLDRIKKNYIEKLEHILKEDKTKKVLPGVRELKYYFEREGHINSILTSNMKIGAVTKLKSVNLADGFLGGGFGDAKGEKWDIALTSQKEIENITGEIFSQEQIVVIGDSVYDIETARKLGYNVIAVSTGWTDKEVLEAADPDVLFDSLQDTDAVIEVINRIQM